MSRCFLSCKGVNDHTSEAMVRTRDLTHVSTHGSEYLKYPPSRPIWAVWFRCRGSGGGWDQEPRSHYVPPECAEHCLKESGPRASPRYKLMSVALAGVIRRNREKFVAETSIH